MTKQEAMRQTEQERALMSLGFTRAEAEALRRISMTLQRWHELECGTGDGQVMRSIERDGDEPDSKPYLRVQYPTSHGYVDRRYPTPDRETGARKRLEKIIAARNARHSATFTDTCECGDKIGHISACDHGRVRAYVQGDPRGAALYIIRPGDVPEGASVDSYYTRGIVVY